MGVEKHVGKISELIFENAWIINSNVYLTV